MADRVVFDCMLYLQAAARPSGPAAACLAVAEQRVVELCLSQDVLAEIRDVLSRPKLQAKFPALTSETVVAFVDRISRFTTTIDTVPPEFSLPRDPKDEKYINLALAAHARFLVSRDNDLLDLNQEGSTEGQALRARCPTLVITDPLGFLQRIAILPEVN